MSSAELTKSAISSMLRTLDPHSSYFDASEYRDLLDEERSEYSGIGSTIVNYKQNGTLETYVIATYANGAAALAGLRYGDKIVAVDGVPMSGLSSDSVRDKIRGPNGSIVRVTIEHAASGRTDIVGLRRALIPQPTVSDAFMLRAGIGYIDLTNGFNYTTSDEVDNALRQMHREGMTSLILDLRGNPGGILEQAVKVAEKFLPAGNLIVSQRGRYSFDNHVWKSANRNPENLPLILLVDSNSASASEVVAGALQDHDRALIIGEKTFGKGLVQSVLNLPAGAGLTLTTARYYTPSGRSIQRDYSNGSSYDYYNHKLALSDSDRARTTVRTDAKRQVFGGDGILPDEVVKSDVLSASETELLDGLFQFSIEAAYGRVPGFEINNAGSTRIRTTAFGTAEEGSNAVQKFLEFASSQVGFDVSLIGKYAPFIETRIRYNQITAKKGASAANRVLLEHDTQIAKALSSLPRANQLARASRR